MLIAADPVDGAVLGYSTFGDFRPWPGHRVLREVGTKFGRWLDLVFMQPFLDTASLENSNA